MQSNIFVVNVASTYSVLLFAFNWYFLELIVFIFYIHSWANLLTRASYIESSFLKTDLFSNNVCKGEPFH